MTPLLENLPESVGAENFLQPVTQMQVEDMSQHCQDTNDGQEDDDSYQEYFKHVCDNELGVSVRAH